MQWRPLIVNGKFSKSENDNYKFGTIFLTSELYMYYSFQIFHIDCCNGDYVLQFFHFKWKIFYFFFCFFCSRVFYTMSWCHWLRDNYPWERVNITYYDREWEISHIMCGRERETSDKIDHEINFLLVEIRAR